MGELVWRETQRDQRKRGWKETSRRQRRMEASCEGDQGPEGL